MRFGLNDLTDLPKVEDMAEVLGFDLPGLGEAGPSDQFFRWAIPSSARGCGLRAGVRGGAGRRPALRPEPVKTAAGP